MQENKETPSISREIEGVMVAGPDLNRPPSGYELLSVVLAAAL